MIRSILAAVVLSLASVSAHAYEIADFLVEEQTQAYIGQLRKVGYRLTQVTDVFADRGIEPRCLCDNFRMKFVGHELGRRDVIMVEADVNLIPGRVSIRFDEVSAEGRE